MKRELRPYQVQALEILRRCVGLGERRIVLAIPTGGGKTVIAVYVIRGALAKGKRVLFVVPALSLIDQTVRMLWDEGIDEIGVIQADHVMTDWSKPVQVASVQTLMRRGMPEADVVIVDECHRIFDFWGKVMPDPKWANVPFIGLSATPWSKGLGKLYNKLIVATTTAELIEQEWLTEFEVFAPSHPDLSLVRTVAGDYHEGDLSEVMSHEPLVADVVETWLKLGENRSTLCFAVDRKHAQHIQARFEAAGVTTGYIDANTPVGAREDVRRKFHNGEIRVVCNIGCLTTGVDWDVRCIILARPTKSEILFVQIIGRGLRLAEGKEELRILDHSDTHLRLGFVTDVHRDKLDDGSARATQKVDKVRLPKECPKCTMLKPIGMRVCPNCGHEASPPPPSKHADGELVAIDRSTRNQKFDIATKQLWWSSLIGLRDERGYKHGWAANNYKEKFGVFPRGLNEVAVDPTAEVRSWVKSRMIRYAKRREAEHARAS